MKTLDDIKKEFWKEHPVIVDFHGGRYADKLGNVIAQATYKAIRPKEKRFDCCNQIITKEHDDDYDGLASHQCPKKDGEYTRDYGSIYDIGYNQALADLDKRYKDFTGKKETTKKPCHDCGVVYGKAHRDGCDWEECPICGGQLISCSCGAEKHNFPIPFGNEKRFDS